MPELLETSLSTADLDRSRRFFEETLGLSPERVGDTSASYETGTCELKLQADFPDDVLEAFNLDAPPETNRGGGAMFVMELDEPLDDVHGRVEATDGGEALIEPRDVPWGVRIFLARSPEGYLFEVRGSDS